MTHSRPWPRSLKILAPLAVLAFSALGARALVLSRPPAARTQTVVPPPLVEVLQVEARDVRVEINAHGEARPLRDIALVAEVAGRVIEVSDRYIEGGVFSKGERILALDPGDYRLALARAEAAVEQARAALSLEEAAAASAIQDWNEIQGGPPPPLVRREPQLARARAELAAAEAAAATARRNLERTEILAPFPCRVAARLADLGQFVGPGTPVGRIHASDAAEVRLSVPDRELQWLSLPGGGAEAMGEGPRVVLSADYAGARRSWEGRILRTTAELDPRTRMAVLVARVNDPYALDGGRLPLPTGLFLEARIEGRLLPGVIRIPRAALRDGREVLVVDAEGRLRRRAVQVLRMARDTALVGDGLRSGEQVCLTPLEVYTDGMAVRTRQSVEPPR